MSAVYSFRHGLPACDREVGDSMNRTVFLGLFSRRPAVLMGVAVLLAAVFVGTNVWSAVVAPGPAALPPDASPVEGVDLSKQTDDQAAAKSVGCIECHKEAHDPHEKTTVHLGCTDCHGGNADCRDIKGAHVQPRFPEVWNTSTKPVRSYTLLNHESPEFVRFVNPGDLRIAHISCGAAGCHGDQVSQVRKSMMTHGAMLWGAALYNNGALPNKRAMYGESYSSDGVPQRMVTVPPPTEEEYNHHGVVPFLDPLPRFEIAQPGNVLRIFERGGEFRPEVGIPNRFEDPGRPILSRLSNRGLGTENRTDPTVLGCLKTRLFDPTLNFTGTNDHPGDYRASGCTACHVVYANDRSVMNAGPYAKYGNKGLSFSKDPTTRKDESGHPIEHRFAPGNGIPTSQCIVCHIHPGTNVLNTYLGMMWWDEETDADLIYPPGGKHLTSEQYSQALASDPNEIHAHNNLTDPAFLENLVELNKVTKHTQFADFHGHGWAFRAVFRQDRKGRFLDHDGKIIENVGNAELQAAMRFQGQKPQDRVHEPGVPVHLMDIHLEKGMHCIDCHFVQDVHGNNRIQDEVRRLRNPVHRLSRHCQQARHFAHVRRGFLHLQPRRRPRLGGDADSFGQASLRARGRESLPEFDGRGQYPLGSHPDGRHGGPVQSQQTLQRQIGHRQDGALRGRRQAGVGRSAQRRREKVRSRQ